MEVYVFSGQGAQYEGMGKALAAENAAARAVYEECSEHLGYDLLSLTADQLSQTRYSQPATVVLSLAACRAYEAALGGTAQPFAMAGFSLGEYSALGASGALDLKTLMTLLERRSELMQAACEQNPGSMYAVLGLSDEEVEAVCAESDLKDKVFAANYNCPGQLVISGDAAASAVAAERLLAKGAKRAVKLGVAGAFHTSLMAPAAEGLKDFATGLTFAAPRCPIYSNVTADRLSDSTDIPAYLAEHMVSPVRWTKEVQKLRADGATRFIEFGPGKTLFGLIRKIDRGAEVARVEDPATLADALG